MNFELGEIKSGAAAFNRGGDGGAGSTSSGGSRSMNFPNVRIDNRFMDDGEKLHSDLVGLTVTAAQRDIEDIFEDRTVEEEGGKDDEEEAEPPLRMEVEDLEQLEEQEVFSLTTRKLNEVQLHA